MFRAAQSPYGKTLRPRWHHDKVKNGICVATMKLKLIAVDDVCGEVKRWVVFVRTLTMVDLNMGRRQEQCAGTCCLPDDEPLWSYKQHGLSF